MEENKDKKIDEFLNIENNIDFSWNDDEDLITKEDLDKLIKMEDELVRITLSKTREKNKGRTIMSMERYRDYIYSAHLDGSLGMTYDEVNETHRKLYGCDFDPKF